MTELRLVPLASPRTPFEAKVLAARLGSEGILWEIRGAVDSMYPVGGIELLVDAQDLDRARELLLVEEVEALFDEEEDAGVPPVGATTGERILAVVAVALLGVLLLARVTMGT